MEVKDLIHESTVASIKTVIWLRDHGRSEAAASRALRAPCPLRVQHMLLGLRHGPILRHRNLSERYHTQTPD